MSLNDLFDSEEFNELSDRVERIKYDLHRLGVPSNLIYMYEYLAFLKSNNEYEILKKEYEYYKDVYYAKTGYLWEGDKNNG